MRGRIVEVVVHGFEGRVDVGLELIHRRLFIRHFKIINRGRKIVSLMIQ